MNLNSIKIKTIERVIAHEIHPKTEEKSAYAKVANQLLNLTDGDKGILIERITEALIHPKKMFQLEHEDKSNTSVFAIVQKVKTLSDIDFVNSSIIMAHNLADAHFRIKIPGGYCLIGEGLTSQNQKFFFVIKAEVQEVFNIQNNQLTLIKDVFLSPAKDFYKVGFFIEEENEFIPFMYDDQYSPQKKDLTEYFYGKFLGLTTDRNDKLRGKNFYEDTKHFIEKNVDNLHDKMGLLRSLNVLYREDTSGVISPKDFGNKYFEGALKSRFEKKVIENKFPHSFTKDISLIDNKIELQRITIPLSFGLSLSGSMDTMNNNIQIIDNPTIETIQQIEPEINNGRCSQIIILKQSS